MSEPVAWMTENGTIFDELPPISGGLIPLYTHPMRELTDEEIYRLWQKHLDDDVPTFARALLKEAGEK